MPELVLGLVLVDLVGLVLVGFLLVGCPRNRPSKPPRTSPRTVLGRCYIPYIGCNTCFLLVMCICMRKQIIKEIMYMLAFSPTDNQLRL